MLKLQKSKNIYFTGSYKNKKTVNYVHFNCVKTDKIVVEVEVVLALP